MNRKILASTTLFLLLATTATALTLDGSCDIDFVGRSTLHSFEGKVACQPFTLTSAGETGEDKLIKQAVVEVLVGEMDTDNTGRDTKMRDMFEQKSYPRIQGLFANFDPDLVLQQLQGVGSAPGHLEFDLRIREISQRVQAVTRDLVITPERISFAMEFPLSLTSFQLQPPSVLGFIKVKDQIQVKARVLLKRH